MTDGHTRPPELGALDCQSAMAMLWDYLDGELGPERERRLREHLEICRPCLKHHDFERAFLDALATARQGDTASPALRERVTSELRQRGLLA